MHPLLLIGLGGFFGALSRYGLSGLVQSLFEGRLFPLGTLAVNVLGCFLLGFFNPLAGERLLIRPEVRLALTVGFLGAFTTFSTYGYETLTQLNDGDWRGAALNFVLNNALGLLAVWAGFRLGESWL